MDEYTSKIFLKIMNYGKAFKERYGDDDINEIEKDIQDLGFVFSHGYYFKIDKIPSSKSYTMHNLDMNVSMLKEKLIANKNPDEDIEKKMLRDICKVIRYVDSVSHIIDPLCKIFKDKKDEYLKSSVCKAKNPNRTKNIMADLYDSSMDDIIKNFTDYAIIFRKKYSHYDINKISAYIFKFINMIEYGLKFEKDGPEYAQIFDLDRYVDIDTFKKFLSNNKIEDKAKEREMDRYIFKIKGYIDHVKDMINTPCKVFERERDEYLCKFEKSKIIQSGELCIIDKFKTHDETIKNIVQKLSLYAAFFKRRYEDDDINYISDDICHLGIVIMSGHCFTNGKISPYMDMIYELTLDIPTFKKKLLSNKNPHKKIDELMRSDILHIIEYVDSVKRKLKPIFIRFKKEKSMYIKSLNRVGRFFSVHFILIIVINIKDSRYYACNSRTTTGSIFVLKYGITDRYVIFYVY